MRFVTARRYGPLTLSLIVGTSLALSACSGGKEEAAPAAADKVYPVTMAVVQPASTSALITAAGTVRYRYETPLGFTTAGKIASIRFQEGDRVMPGALIAALDATQVGANLESARAEQQRAQAELAGSSSCSKRAGSRAHSSNAPRRPRAPRPRRSAPQALPAVPHASSRPRAA